MTPFGRGGSPRRGLAAEYVVAGADLALVRVDAGSPDVELLVFTGGALHSFEPLPGAPGGDDRAGFPVPLALLRAGDADFRVVVDGAELQIEPPSEAGASAPAPAPPAPGPDPELLDARAEAERERERRGAVAHEPGKRATAPEWGARRAGALPGGAEEAAGGAGAGAAAP